MNIKLNKMELMEILKEYVEYNDFNTLSRKLYLQVEDSKDVIILLKQLKQLKQDILKYDENFRDSEIKNNIHSLTNQYYLEVFKEVMKNIYVNDNINLYDLFDIYDLCKENPTNYNYVDEQELEHIILEQLNKYETLT